MKRKTEIFISIIISIVFLGCANSNKANNNSNEDLLEPSLTPTASYSFSAEDVDSILSSITDNSGLYQLIIEDDIPDEKYIARALNNYSEIFVILDFSKTKLETISFNTFANPTIKKIILPDTLKIIGKDAFYGCTNLVSINIPDSVTEIKDSAFQSCSELKQIQIGKNVILLGEQAFTSCVKLESIKWGESLETIGMKAFSSCDKLSSVIIPDSVKTIKSYAFRNCVSLKKVTIGKGTQFLEWEIFVRCPSLTSIKFIDKNDWYRTTSNLFKNGTKTDLSNTSENAKYFTQTYSDCYWYKN